MITYRTTANDKRFTTIAVSTMVLDEMIGQNGFPFHVGSEGTTDSRLPWQVQAFHIERYCDRFAEITVDEVVAHPVLRLSRADEISEGRSSITVIDGLETIAALRDAGIDQIEVEVLRREAVEIEARLTR